MGTSTLQVLWYNSFHDVSCLEPVLRMLFLGISTRKAKFAHETHLSTSMPIGCDCQRYDSRSFNLLRSTFAYTCSIQPMLFRQFSRSPIVFGESPRATLNWQSKIFQSLEQF